MADLVRDARAAFSADVLEASVEVRVPVATLFAMIADVESWPVWFACVRAAERLEPTHPLALGSEVRIRSTIPGADDDVYDVDQFLDGHILALVGGVSTRRRIDFRLTGRTQTCRLALRVDYPAYGGRLGRLADRIGVRRRLARTIADSLVHLRGLAEFGAQSSGEEVDLANL